MEHVIYDVISSDAALNAYQNYYGIRGLADYDFSEVKVLVSIDADVVGDWQGGGFEGGYAKSRIPKGVMVKQKCHGIFSSNLICLCQVPMQIIGCHVLQKIKKMF